MKIRHHLVSRRYRLSILFLLVIGFGSYATARSATIAELEADLKNCQKNLANLSERIKKEKQEIDQLSHQCTESYNKYIKIKNEPPLSYRNADAKYKEKEDEYIRLEREQELIASELKKMGRRCDQDARCNKKFVACQKCLDELVLVRKRHREEEWTWNNEIQRQENAYKSCQKKLNERTSVYNSLWPLWKSTDSECAQLQAKLNAAKQQEQAYPGTPVGLLVECNPMQVQVGGTVTCTAHGTFLDPNTKQQTTVDITNHSETKWHNGPRFSAKGLKAGQTVVVTATKGSASDSKTITVVDEKVFNAPMYGGGRLDWCMTYGGPNCGGSVANTFCQKQGYDHASGFEGEILSNTVVISDGRKCSPPDRCGGFKYIKCTKKKK